MFIETTLNIKKKILDKINNSSSNTGISRSKIIKLLFARTIKDNHKLVKSNRGIVYQDSNDNNDWHKFHIVYRIDEYEYYLDMRKLFKMSLSRILAYAVESYMREIMKKLTVKNREKFTDNYPLKNYITIKDLTTGVVCWKLFWWIPVETGKNQLPSHWKVKFLPVTKRKDRRQISLLNYWISWSNERAYTKWLFF